jgi:hypothetical protein
VCPVLVLLDNEKAKQTDNRNKGAIVQRINGTKKQ